jgi:hypothetical protein
MFIVGLSKTKLGCIKNCSFRMLVFFIVFGPISTQKLVQTNLNTPNSIYYMISN